MVYVQHVFLWDSHSLYTSRSTQHPPLGMCVLFSHRTLADKEGCLEDFLPVQKQRDERQRAQNLFYPFSLGNYTDKAWKIVFFSLWNAGRNCVKTEQRDCEKWLIVAISLHVWFARLCARVLNSQISVAYSVSVCAQMQGHFRMSSFVEYNVCLCMSSTYRFRTGALLVC